MNEAGVVLYSATPPPTAALIAPVLGPDEKDTFAIAPVNAMHLSPKKDRAMRPRVVKRNECGESILAVRESHPNTDDSSLSRTAHIHINVHWMLSTGDVETSAEAAPPHFDRLYHAAIRADIEGR